MSLLPFTNLQNLMKPFIDQIQETEDVCQDLIVLRLISTALGTQLDGVGSIVGEDRNGKTDDLYREAIYERIFINVSNGEPETLIDVLKFLTEATLILYQEIYPADIQMWSDGQTIPPNLGQTMQSVTPAGVGDIEISMSLGGLPFVLALEDAFTIGIDNPAGKGVNENAYTEGGEEVGGQLAEQF